MRAVLIDRGAADVDELLDAGLLRGVDQRDYAAIVDSLEGEAAARIFDRVTVELDRIDDRARALERVGERCGLCDIDMNELDARQIQLRARLLRISREHAHFG